MGSPFDFGNALRAPHRMRLSCGPCAGTKVVNGSDRSAPQRQFLFNTVLAALA